MLPELLKILGNEHQAPLVFLSLHGDTRSLWLFLVKISRRSASCHIQDTGYCNDNYRVHSKEISRGSSLPSEPGRRVGRSAATMRVTSPVDFVPMV